MKTKMLLKHNLWLFFLTVLFLKISTVSAADYTVVLLGENEPFVSKDSSGFSVDIMNAVAKNQGITVQYKYIDSHFDNRNALSRAIILVQSQILCDG